MIVVDASAMVEALRRTAAGRAVEDRLFAPAETLHAPHVLDLEVAQVVRRLAASGAADDARSRAMLEDLADFPVLGYPHAELLPRIWELRRNFTACDAAYVALAEVLGATLVTCDQPLAAACRRLGGVSVELV